MTFFHPAWDTTRIWESQCPLWCPGDKVPVDDLFDFESFVDGNRYISGSGGGSIDIGPDPPDPNDRETIATSATCSPLGTQAVELQTGGTSWVSTSPLMNHQKPWSFTFFYRDQGGSDVFIEHRAPLAYTGCQGGHLVYLVEGGSTVFMRWSPATHGFCGGFSQGLYGPGDPLADEMQPVRFPVGCCMFIGLSVDPCNHSVTYYAGIPPTESNGPAGVTNPYTAVADPLQPCWVRWNSSDPATKWSTIGHTFTRADPGPAVDGNGDPITVSPMSSFPSLMQGYHSSERFRLAMAGGTCVFDDLQYWDQALSLADMDEIRRTGTVA